MEIEDSVNFSGVGVGRIEIWLSEDPDGTYLEAVIAHKDSLIGYLDFGAFQGMSTYVQDLLTSKPIIYFESMVVRDVLGGKGIGTAMLSRGLEIAREYGVKKIFLQRDSNSRSSDEALARLYRKFGFVDIEIDNEDEDDPMPAMELSLR